MIKKFVAWNKRMSVGLQEKYPSMFADKRHVTQFQKELEEMLAGKENINILETGGIDRPLLKKSPKFTYIGLDVEERDNCYDVYDKFMVASVEDDLGSNEFDYVISKFLLEHVPNNAKTFQAMYNGLKKDGEMLHIFPGRNHPRSALTRLVGHKLQNKLIKILRPWTKDGVSGYKTFFSLCTKGELNSHLNKIGYSKVDITCFWGARDYFAFFVPAFIFISLFNKMCESLNLTYFASAIILYAKK